MKRIFPALVSLALLVVLAGAASPASPPAATGSAFAVQVIVPGQSGASAGAVTAPPNAQGDGSGFAYPADGSVVRVGGASTSVAVRDGAEPSSQAVADVLDVSLFNGEVTLAAAAARASATAGAATSTGSTEGSGLSGLVVLGAAVAPSPNGQVALGDWGFAVMLSGSAEQAASGRTRNGAGSLSALRVTLTADHGGLPAGSEIVIGHAEAAASFTAPAPQPATTAKPPTTAGTTGTTATTTTGRKALPKPPERKPGPPGPPVYRQPPDVDVHLTPGRYVFPVFGAAAFSDTFGAPRASTTWHHGEDIFGQIGQPLLAVADGTVFSVGWNEVGGYRLWLRDRAGNQYYYAHLSAYSPLAINGREVRAGDVLGFMGNTGDAQGTPPHLHFEIHPVALLPMGYDGVVKPYPYLIAWQRLQDVTIAASRGWVPLLAARGNAPQPGAILLQSTDISSASGLDVESLERALVAPAQAEGDGTLVRSE